MTDLFQAAGLEQAVRQPLAESIRPKTLTDVVGQDHLVGETGPLRLMADSGHLTSVILWGPPGVGKTTIAQLLAADTGLAFEALSAVFSGVKDLRGVFDRAEARRKTGQGSVLFVDEIHRFNKAQQDSFLPYVERGVVILIGATTENPSFELNGALLSRCQVLTLHPLDDAALDQLIGRAETFTGRRLPVDGDGRSLLKSLSGGDGRYFLGLLEDIWRYAKGDDILSVVRLRDLISARAAAYDKSGEGHYNLISALHKSVRGSDPDAALYWFARMLAGGEDPLFLGRRLIRMASEDIGLADPTALLVAGEAVRSYERLGSPEGELALAHAVVHLATAPKSNAIYTAYKAAMQTAKQTGSLPPPKTILNAPTEFMKSEGYGDGYIYDHDTEHGFSGQAYFPEKLGRQSFYAPKGDGREKAIRDRLDYWAQLRSRLQNAPETE